MVAKLVLSLLLFVVVSVYSVWATFTYSIFEVVLITARREEIVGITEQLLSFVDNGDSYSFLLVQLFVSY